MSGYLFSIVIIDNEFESFSVQREQAYLQNILNRAGINPSLVFNASIITNNVQSNEQETMGNQVISTFSFVYDLRSNNEGMATVMTTLLNSRIQSCLPLATIQISVTSTNNICYG